MDDWSAVIGRVVLVSGKEEYLNERTVRAIRSAVRALEPEVEVAETDASSLSLAVLGELAAPSLFSATRLVEVRGLEDLPEEAHDGVVRYAEDPAPDVALVLVHGGGPKGSGLLKKLRALPQVHEAHNDEVKPSELTRFVAGEFRQANAACDEGAAAALVQSIGGDLRGLAAAAHQLAADFPGERITESHVTRYFGGRAEAKSFAVADATFAGRRVVALEELRWALAAGTAPVLVTSAFAAGARGLAHFLDAPRGLRDVDLAKVVGVPPWKLRTLRDQSRGWDSSSIAHAVRAIAQADADVKGQASDASYTLERLVLTVAGLRVG